MEGLWHLVWALRRRGGWQRRRGERRESGREEKMKEVQIEDLASRDHPESCANVRKDGGEALTGARTGWVLSSEITDQGADALPFCGGQHVRHEDRECSSGPAGSKAPRTCGTSWHGNREILGLPAVMVPTAAMGRPRP
jgi:hypothetical protein